MRLLSFRFGALALGIGFLPFFSSIRCLLPHLFGLLLVLGRIDAVGIEDFLVLVRLFQHLLHDRKHVFDTFRRYTVKREPLGVFALPEEVGEEVVQHVAMTVEAQELPFVFRFGGSHVRRAVAFQPRDDADLARLLVLDDQNVLFFFPLFHNRLIFNCILIDVPRI